MAAWYNYQVKMNPNEVVHPLKVVQVIYLCICKNYEHMYLTSTRKGFTYYAHYFETTRILNHSGNGVHC